MTPIAAAKHTATPRRATCERRISSDSTRPARGGRLGSPMTRPRRSILGLVALWAIGAGFAALRAEPQLPGPVANGPPAEASDTVRDPYGRETPRGTFFGFLRAAGSGRYAVAA